MDRETLELVIWFGPPILAGGIAIYFSLRRATPMSALNWGFYVTWGLGVVLGILTGFTIELLFPRTISRALMAGPVQLLISFLAGIVVGGGCALWVRSRGALRGAATTQDEPTPDPLPTSTGAKIVTLIFWLVAGGIALLLSVGAFVGEPDSGTWWQMVVAVITLVILGFGVRQCIHTFRGKKS